MKQKNVIITGANSGIGKAAALTFAYAGYTVIMACRNLNKGKTAQQEIIEASKNNHVHLMELDTSSLHSIEAFSRDYKKRFEKLDILINNAAYFNHGEGYQLSPDNIELTFATNVVGPFLLMELLKDELKKSDDPRILNASSNITKHFFSPKKTLDFETITGELPAGHKHSVYVTYRNSKMALLMLTFKMAGIYKEYGITVNSLQINGARMSKETLQKFAPRWRFIARIQNLFFPPASFMADNYFELCTSERYEKLSGKQFNQKLKCMRRGPVKPTLRHILGSDFYPTYAANKAAQEKVWNICQSLVKDYLKQKPSNSINLLQPNTNIYNKACEPMMQYAILENVK